jgi:RNA polymerase-associated protein RTF1
MLARKSEAQSNKYSPAFIKTEKSRLMQARTLAIRRQDTAELADLDEKLAELNAIADRTPHKEDEGTTDLLSRVNQRNRKANIEAVRQAELREAERKRRERKLAAQGGSGAGTPDLQDRSVRLKTVPRTFNAVTPRAGTPSTPVIVPSQPSSGLRPISPMPSIAKSTSLEASIIDSIEVNLGDF